MHHLCIIDVCDANHYLLELLDVIFYRMCLPEVDQGIPGLPLLINDSILAIYGLAEILKIRWHVANCT